MLALLATPIVSNGTYQQTMKVTLSNPESSSLKADEAGVVETIKAVDHAWNTHNMDAFAELLTEDCQWVNVVGMWWNGKDSIKRAHQAFHSTFFKNVSLRTDEARLREIAPHVVAAILDTHLGAYTTPSGHQTPEGEYRMTMILKEEGGRWLIVSAQNTPIDAIAARFDPGAPKT